MSQNKTVEADAGSPVVTACPNSPAAELFVRIAQDLLAREPKRLKMAKGRPLEKVGASN